MNITIIFHRLGPYHIARLQAAARYATITCIELSGITQSYQWELIQGDFSFKRITLFANQDSRTIPLRELRGRLFAALERIKIDVLVVNGWSDKGALLGLSWALDHEVPTLVMSESTSIDFKRVLWKEWIKKNLVTLFHGAIVGGQPHVRYMCQLGMEQSRIKIGYDVVDNDYFVRETTTLRLNSTSSHFANPYFLTSNRFIPKKNLFRLLKAYFEYRKIVPKPWDLVLLGDGPLKEEIKNMIYDLGLSNYVHLPGFCQYNELPTYYAFAQAFVHSSTSEQWGLVINEAMASGLPILVSNRCGCAEDLVHTDKNGIKFDPYDIEAITAALVNITTVANEKREEMGVNSLEIIENFKPKHFGENLNLLSVQAMNTNLKPTILARIILKILLRFSTK